MTVATLEQQLEVSGANGPQGQLAFAAAMPPDRLRERLAEIDVDALSPRQALELLFELNAEAKDRD